MAIRKQDIQRRIIYQNVKRANSDTQVELAYNEFDGYEIMTIHTLGGIKTLWFSPPTQQTIKTYRWFGNNLYEELEEYVSIEKALKGHQKWCQKEFV